MGSCKMLADTVVVFFLGFPIEEEAEYGMGAGVSHGARRPAFAFSCLGNVPSPNGAATLRGFCSRSEPTVFDFCKSFF